MFKKIKDNIWQFYFKSFGSCVYLVKLKNYILIDAGSEDTKEELKKDLEELNISPMGIKIVLLTHNHWDHAGGLDLFENAKVYSYENMHELKIKEIKVIATPGHTKDSVCFLYEDVLFSGDTIFHDGIGRTDFPESKPEKMQKSLEKLKKINYKILCPGHLV